MLFTDISFNIAIAIAFLALFVLGRIFVKSAVDLMMNSNSLKNQTKGDSSGD